MQKEEKKESLLKRAGLNKETHLSVQDTIPYVEMARDGICKVSEGVYSKTVKFFDINYQLARDDDKKAILEKWCEFLNYFDSSIHLQFSFINHHSNMSEYESVISIEPQKDNFNDIRKEYSEMLKEQLSKGNNGLVREKYITFSIRAKDVKEAKPRLERIETDVINSLKLMGVEASALDGAERLKVLYEMFNPDSQVPFRFSYDQLIKSGLSTKDYIAPSSFVFDSSKYFQMGNTTGAVSFLQILAPEFEDTILQKYLEIDHNLVLNIHIEAIDQLKAIKLIKAKVTDIDKMKIEEQKKAVRAGYDMDIIPSDLALYGEEAKELMNALQSRNERLFLVTILFLNTDKKKRDLDNTIMQISGIAQGTNCMMRRLDYQQEQGLVSSLPLGVNTIPIKRGLTTSATAIFVPFTTQELFMPGESLYYGINATSNNMIMADRKQLKNPNGLILGTPGSGKSMSAKREITNAFFVTRDDIIIGDPEGEYYPLVNALGGQVIRISSTSKDYINAHSGLAPEEKSVIDRCLPIVYSKYFKDPVPENMPILGDLYNTLRAQKEDAAQGLATALEIYVNGSLKVFNHQTNVNLDNRIICFDIKELGNQLKKLGMLIIQDQVWNRVTINRAQKKATRYFIDEFHLLLKEPQTAAYSVEIWKRFRKWGGIPTGITQNVTDFLGSPEIQNIIENSDFVYLLNQGKDDRDILAKRLNISKEQLAFVTNSPAGSGLIIYGSVIIPFKDKMNKNMKLYKLMTTKPEEVEGRKDK